MVAASVHQEYALVHIYHQITREAVKLCKKKNLKEMCYVNYQRLTEP